MMRPNYRDFRRSQFVIESGETLEHSAKGSSWKDHKYIKRIDGTYYYPDSYEGGRHLPDGDKSKLENWEKTMYDDIEETLRKNPGLFDPSKIASDDFQNFKVTLAEFAGINTDNLSNEEIERMRKRVQDHYNAEKEKSDRKVSLSSTDIENLANEVIRGKFGNGQERKDLLGENYAEVQARVNELMKGSIKKSGSKKIPENKNKEIGLAEKAAKNAVAMVEAYRKTKK